MQMSRAIDVPVTPSVLQWVIDDSGYDFDEIAQAAGVDSEILRQWVTAKGHPTITQARKLAAKVHRPFATLFLPRPPQRPRPSVDFRHPSDVQRSLNANERRYLRRAARLQDSLAWLSGEMRIPGPSTPAASIDQNPATVAAEIRSHLGISTQQQKRWATTSQAFDNWRVALEQTGYLVFLFSLGKNSCSGFSIWNDSAPVIAVNTAWNESARIFTLFHEFGHLLTRTDSACLESRRTSGRVDPIERWCERFAAELLMPDRDLLATLRERGWRPGTHITDLNTASHVARLYKVSLRAAVIQLIELNATTWNLYDEIPPLSDYKPFGGGGRGRDRTQIREDQLGERTTALLVAGVERDVISRSQAVDLLDIPDVRFDEISSRHPR